MRDCAFSLLLYLSYVQLGQVMSTNINHLQGVPTNICGILETIFSSTDSAWRIIDALIQRADHAVWYVV